MSRDPLRPIRIAARDEHKKLSLIPRMLAVVASGKIVRASTGAHRKRHVVMGCYDKDVPMKVFVEDAEAAFAELLES